MAKLFDAKFNDMRKPFHSQKSAQPTPKMPWLPSGVQAPHQAPSSSPQLPVRCLSPLET
ncbi:hypothetical protein Scep_021496 [Stephania cephalantha]|uniref:Uncharacterized protein n=1 Tax=Stephania cephalantha TaxID=152367 RepID=A0AAP0I0A0_9MAGN